MPNCSCQCKLCRAPGPMHCRSGGHGCAAAQTHHSPAAGLSDASSQRPAPEVVASAMRRLKLVSGSHSPSVGELERALPGVVEIDACFLSNPYATEEVLRRFRSMAPATLERMVSHYPSQGAGIAASLARHVGVDPDCLFVANGACEAIDALLGTAPGAALLPIPTFSAYYELAAGPVVVHQLDADDDFRLDLDALWDKVERLEPQTVVVITPNNPDGGLVDRGELVKFLGRTRGLVGQVIVDESFAQFSSEEPPTSFAGYVREFPHLVVVNSMSKSHGIAGLRLGYAVMAPVRVRRLRASRLWNTNAFAQWFCELLGDDGYQDAYEAARRRYVRDTRQLFAQLGALPGIEAHPSSANFALLRHDRAAAPVAAELLARHGVYVRDCADKWGLDGDRYLRIASRTRAENDRIVAALADVLERTRHAAPWVPADAMVA